MCNFVQVKNTWVNNVMSKEWGIPILARIQFRANHDGREPSAAHITEATDTKVKREGLKKKVAREDIMNAFVSGEEVCKHVYQFDDDKLTKVYSRISASAV